ncbi:WUSCHEL-related homeobox 8-like [Primulina tabacum]|uniref:WUSCHEL-related homeobox 8-like n=1 Tax=Primulina tabacum TaxID=48773 RepID=UPI003F5967C0
MASSNKHWPRMFKSKPCNTTHYQWRPHDLNSSSFMSAAYPRSPYSPVPGYEERTPEPKPRWNPRPEQIRILEAIFNSGMVNPPRDEIRKIRVQLQEYGQVGDANVFYWFQNRKSRSKHKQRQQQSISKSKKQQAPTPRMSNKVTTTIPTASSSSSSDKFSQNNSAEKAFYIGSSTMIDLINSPTASVNQSFLPTPNEFLAEPFLFPVHQNTGGPSAAFAASLAQGFCFSDVSSFTDHRGIGNGTSFLLSELMLMKNDSLKEAEDEKIKLQQHLCDTVATASNNSGNAIFTPSLAVPSPTDHHLQGTGGMGPTKSTVFINDVCFEVGSGPFNVKQAFGDDAVLLQSSEQPVPTNEWGITLQPLCHGQFYYLLRAFTPTEDRTVHLK